MEETEYKLMGKGQTWNDLLAALLQLSKSADGAQRECAFRIFATTPGIIEKSHEVTVGDVFISGFKDPDVAVCTIPAYAHPAR